MRKISWLAILLIGGCTLIVEQSNLVSLMILQNSAFWMNRYSYARAVSSRKKVMIFSMRRKIKNVWKRMPSKCKSCPNRLSRRMI